VHKLTGYKNTKKIIERGAGMEKESGKPIIGTIKNK
jgi:hypothetical protein